MKWSKWSAYLPQSGRQQEKRKNSRNHDDEHFLSDPQADTGIMVQFVKKNSD